MTKIFFSRILINRAKITVRRDRALAIPNLNHPHCLTIFPVKFRIGASGLNSFTGLVALTLLTVAVSGHSLGPFFHNLEPIEKKTTILPPGVTNNFGKKSRIYSTAGFPQFEKRVPYNWQQVCTAYKAAGVSAFKIPPNHPTHTTKRPAHFALVCHTNTCGV